LPDSIRKSLSFSWGFFLFKQAEVYDPAIPDHVHIVLG